MKRRNNGVLNILTACYSGILSTMFRTRHTNEVQQTLQMFNCQPLASITIPTDVRNIIFEAIVEV